MTVRGRYAPLSSGLGIALAALALLTPRLISAASYLPLSDADLARRSPIIVRARVVSRQVRHSSLPDGGADILSTATTLRVLEAIRGTALLPGDMFELDLPGGVDGAEAYRIPGTPEFAEEGEVVLVLAPADGGFSLTEFGLSKFDLLRDASGRAFAVRPVFSDDEDDLASNRPTRILAPQTAQALQTATIARPRELRDAGSFLASLRGAAAGATAAPTLYATPAGALNALAPTTRPAVKHPLWVNIGGVEGTGSQFRWYWDTALSPGAIISASGTQTGLSDGSDGVSAVQNGAAQWHAVPGTDVRYSTSSGSGPVVVHLDVTSEPGAWTDPLPCTSGGIIGYGGPGSSRSAPTFKGDGDFFAPSSGNVWMRKVTGGCYSSATFRTAVLHELGHTLGLGHSDDPPSRHSTTTTADQSAAVMHSILPASHPSSPQTDDVQAIQYYYGTGAVTPPPPLAAFSFTPTSPRAGQTVFFVDGSTGGPTAWLWSFGDGTSSTAQNPAHVFASAGSRNVTLTVTNAGGSSSATRVITLSPGGAGTAPSSAFSFSPLAPAPGSSVQFTDSSTGSPDTWLWSFGDSASGSANTSVLQNPAHTFAAAGTYTVSLTVRNANGSSVTTLLVNVAGCGAGALCLNAGRFRVTATWSVPTQGTSGIGNPVALTGDTGYFWFFTSNNVELIVKLVDGRPVNDRFWFFSGALSNVEYTVLVSDTQTGVERAYFNPQGQLQSYADTSAFAPSGSASDTGTLQKKPASPPPADFSSTEADASPCTASLNALCLNAGRFRVAVDWQVPAQSTSGSGFAVPLTTDTGYFWFFTANNVELVVKVVDGRAFNGRFWVFSGALSDVGYTITVTDTTTGAARHYTSPAGALTSFADVSAF